MLRGGVGLIKLKCGEAAKRSATRLPTSRGEEPRGQLLKSDCAVTRGAREAARARAQAARIRRVLINVLLLCVRGFRRSAVSRPAPEFDCQRLALLDEVRLRELAAGVDVHLQSITRARDR